MKKINKKIGIIGGLGPEATALFYLKIIEKYRVYNYNNLPEIFIHNVPISFKLDHHLMSDNTKDEEIKKILKDSIKKINKNNVDLIAIPCNSIHSVLEDIKYDHKKILNIVEEMVSYVKKYDIKKVGLLATKKTIKSKIYSKYFSANSMTLLTPSLIEQKEINRIIDNILLNIKSEDDKNYLLSIIERMKNNGAEAIILGCTDLVLLLKNYTSNIHIFDSLDVLAESVVENIVK